MCELIWVAVDPATATPKQAMAPLHLSRIATRNTPRIATHPPQVCELIWVTVDPATATPNPAMAPLAADLVGAVLELRPRFTTALRVAQAGEQAAGGGGWRCDRGGLWPGVGRRSS